MKKGYVSVWMILLLICFCVAGSAEENIRFEPTLTNILDLSGEEWFESSTKRAMLSIMLVVEYGNKYDSEAGSEMVQNTSYVGYSEESDILMVLWEGEDDLKKMILYAPGGEAIYTESEISLSLATWANLLSSEMDTEMKKNTSSAISSALEMLSEALDEI